MEIIFLYVSFSLQEADQTVWIQRVAVVVQGHIAQEINTDRGAGIGQDQEVKVGGQAIYILVLETDLGG